MTDVERIIEELRPIAEKLGEGAVEVYKLAVRQAMIEGITAFLVTLGCVFGALVAYQTVRWCQRQAAAASVKPGRYSADTEGYIIGGVVAALAGIASGIVALSYFVQGIQYLLNPKWAAVEIILRQVS